MSNLSPKLQTLVLAGKGANCPTSADFDRVRSALEARLGDVVFPSSEVASTTGSNGLLHVALGKFVGLTAVGLALAVGSIALFASHHREAQEGSIATFATVTTPTITAPEPSQLAIGPSRETESSKPTAAEPPSASTRTSGDMRSREPARDRDGLAEEVAILSRAEAELYRGRPTKALELLGEHERKFASGALVEERTAARVQALCALGRNAEADAQFARLKPGSLHGNRSRSACERAQITKTE